MPRSSTTRSKTAKLQGLQSSEESDFYSSASSLTNSEIAELLATEAESASQPLQKAFRRAARKALLWPDEAYQLQQEQRSLTELPGIGPYLEKIVSRWLRTPPPVPTPPHIRQDVLSWTEVQAVLRKAPS